MRYNIFLIIFLLPVFSFSQPTAEQMRQVEEAKKEVRRMKGSKFPEFELTTIDGKTYTNKDFEGKVLVVNFWFSSCKPCIVEMPEMNELVEEYKNEEIVFLAPTFDDEERVRKFLTRRDFDYEIVADVKDFCLALNVRSYPTHFVINREGIIERVIIGYYFGTMKALRKSVRKLLKS
ncbi:MAG: TlpA disulfide reductase family protein [Ekhidna sp.]